MAVVVMVAEEVALALEEVAVAVVNNTPIFYEMKAIIRTIA
jgi:hypothetical protein